MAKKKSAGAVRQGKRTAGKRLGLKVPGGAQVKPGQIIIRQRGSIVKPGEGVGMGKDYTIFAKKPGTVQFGYVNRGKRKVSVV